jgi:hypothetical protein
MNKARAIVRALPSLGTYGPEGMVAIAILVAFLALAT